MRKIKGSFIFTVVIAATLSWADVTRSKAAELSVHKAERLVSLGKIEETYLTNLVEIELTDVVQMPNGTIYKSHLKQFPGADNTQKILEVLMDKDGRVTAYSVIEGAVSSDPLEWPITDSAGLFEAALHYLIENGPSDPAVKPFDSDYTRMVISQEPDGNTVRAHFRSYSSTNTSQTENVYVKADSAFDHAEITTP